MVTLLPNEILNRAIQEVPAVKYALGVSGVAAAVAIINHFIGTSSSSWILLVLVFVGMILLFLFSALISSAAPAIQLAGEVLVWAVLIFFLIFLGFTALAFATGLPCNWADIVGVKTPHPSCLVSHASSAPIPPVASNQTKESKSTMESSSTDAPASQPENAASRVVAFSVLVPDAQNVPAPQLWTWKTDHWDELHPDGTVSVHLIEKRISLNRCDGSLSFKEEFPGLEFFVPEKGCPGMKVMFRRDKSPWQPWLPMIEIKYGSN
jgi:hypothetical protein